LCNHLPAERVIDMINRHLEEIVDAVFESTNCLIAGRRALPGSAEALRRRIVDGFRRAVSAPAPR